MILWCDCDVNSWIVVTGLQTAKRAAERSVPVVGRGRGQGRGQYSTRVSQSVSDQEKLGSWYLTRYIKPDLSSPRGGWAPGIRVISPPSLLALLEKVLRSGLAARLKEEVVNHFAVFIRS